MVAKVISGKTIRGALSYNENKVVEGVAQCIMANQFGSEPKELSFHQKLNRFQKLMDLNRKVKTNAIHISLNFDVTEKIGVDSLNKIATSYMDKIGFGDQPFLVYQHLDAGHPHIHILSTNIQSTGKRIDIHNIGRNQSEKARKEIEMEFNLVRAESKKKSTDEIQGIDPSRVVYGKSETKRSISNVVRYVTKNYKYSSLPELNAALRQFNVIADRGEEGTVMHSKNGLRFSVLDKNGNKIGVPIKASAIYGKPTLKFLEKQFKLNEILKAASKERVKVCIDNCFGSRSTISKKRFNESLKAEGIYVLLRQNSDGNVYGITFVDNKTRTVFNGSSLGKAYGAKAIMDRISDLSYPMPVKQEVKGHHHLGITSHKEFNFGFGELISDLVFAEKLDHTSPEAAMKLKRRKKRRGRSI